MRKPTEEQAKILQSDARVRLVLAAPGSGKTWLVAEAIRQALEQEPDNGIAALSFTNVAGEEIRRAVGYELGHPHYVGTIDSFMYRYITRPFGHLLPWHRKPPYFRIIPDDRRPQKWKLHRNDVHLDVALGNKSRRCHLFNAVFVGEKDGQPVLAERTRWTAGLSPLSESEIAILLKAKRQFWEKTGWLSHSDAAFLAASILRDESLGRLVSKTLTDRFRFIVVDELQDTGWFLGEALLHLLASQKVTALLVGDPDQAIYEFGGVRPELCHRFEQLEGVCSLPLRQSRRCPKRICCVAEHLSQTNSKILPDPDKADGETLLLTYEDAAANITALVEALSCLEPGALIRAVSRRNDDVDAVNRQSCKSLDSVGSPAIGHLHHAVCRFRLGRNDQAIGAAIAALARAALGTESVDDDQLVQKDIDPVEWRLVAYELLLEADVEPPGESFLEWADRMLARVETKCASLMPGWNSHLRRPAKNKTASEVRSDYLPARSASGAAKSPAAKTVHAVKGETHDTTILYCPVPKKENQCPSEVWWTNDSAQSEEQRIAFVAVTRPRSRLIIMVNEQTAERLHELRPEFTAAFRCLKVAEYLAELRDSE